MIWQRVRIALLASMVALAAALPVAPGKAFAGSCGADCGQAAPCPVGRARHPSGRRPRGPIRAGVEPGWATERRTKGLRR